MRKSMLLDQSKCIACRGCQVACKQWNQLPAEDTKFAGSYENPPGISPHTWMRITFKEVEGENGQVKWLFGNKRCMHCGDAACMTACPTGAIYKTDAGTVNIDYTKCIGCNYCAANCPFNVISFDRRTNVPPKCTFCYDRISNGFKPACAGVCPTGAIVFGNRSEIIAAATDRAAELQANGNAKARVYGLEELEGTGMIFVLEDEPEQYALLSDPQVPFSTRLWGVLFRPLRVLVVIALAFGLWSNRVQSREVEEAKKSSS